MHLDQFPQKPATHKIVNLYITYNQKKIVKTLLVEQRYHIYAITQLQTEG
jgi:DNA-dependent RNA polymerase auxiliary subunit epsilon